MIDKILVLQDRLPEWRLPGLYADHLRPQDSLERREAARLDRLLRQQRAAGGERNHERVFRERARPRSDDKGWTLRKWVWRERSRRRWRRWLWQRARFIARP